jgi:hypothetical protein
LQAPLRSRERRCARPRVALRLVVPGNARGSERALRGRRLGRANLPVEARPGKLRAGLGRVSPRAPLSFASVPSCYESRRVRSARARARLRIRTQSRTPRAPRALRTKRAGRSRGIILYVLHAITVQPITQRSSSAEFACDVRRTVAYRPVCSCGWKGRGSSSVREARAAGHDHVRVGRDH